MAVVDGTNQSEGTSDLMAGVDLPTIEVPLTPVWESGFTRPSLRETALNMALGMSADQKDQTFVRDEDDIVRIAGTFLAFLRGDDAEPGDED